MTPPSAGGKRLVVAGVVGLVLSSCVVAVMVVVSLLPADSRHCGPFGCLGVFQQLVDIWDIGRWVAIVLAWPLLRAVGVRPAWLVALLAVPVLLVTWWVAGVSRIDVQLALTFCGGLIAYPVAAWAAARVLRLR
ncbi:hypothetical protein SAMN05421874_10232 [Nonomuraea maritima]|uniref:Uncharacterized protein n=1 Tax=Nonomuraea maritima TaxID=683260 RepID=A0A1G8UA87_9ACTN|nr:hypothetical protein [Nonomuraea maritima]SDJ50697.1 hypothetical protein SAMN05421874_10232 [Nonomuraea maritima]